MDGGHVLEELVHEDLPNMQQNQSNKPRSRWCTWTCGLYLDGVSKDHLAAEAIGADELVKAGVHVLEEEELDGQLACMLIT